MATENSSPQIREMDPRFLQEDELLYELKLRGVPSLMYVAQGDLAQLLRNHINRDVLVAQVTQLKPQ